MQSVGPDDSEDARALRQQRYVATTNDHELLTSVPCVGEREVSLFTAVYTGTHQQTNAFGDLHYFYVLKTVGAF